MNTKLILSVLLISLLWPVISAVTPQTTAAANEHVTHADMSDEACAHSNCPTEQDSMGCVLHCVTSARTPAVSGITGVWLAVAAVIAGAYIQLFWVRQTPTHAYEPAPIRTRPHLGIGKRE